MDWISSQGWRKTHFPLQRIGVLKKTISSFILLSVVLFLAYCSPDPMQQTSSRGSLPSTTRTTRQFIFRLPPKTTRVILEEASRSRIETTTTILRPTTTRKKPVVTAKKPAVSSSGGLPAYLVCVRWRESRGDYTVVNKSSGAGGAFQFLPSTWRNTVRHAGRTDLLGILPQHASHADQDAMAIHLLGWQGTSPWGGHCP